MIYNSVSELKSILSQLKITAKKRLGQNFLIHHPALAKIIEAAELNINDVVIEIGPGLGFLTNELLKHAHKVISIELDQDLIPYLQSEFRNAKNFELVNQDALKYVPTEAKYKLVANIPYYITSPLIHHFLRAKKQPECLVLLVQRDVAEKICAQPGSHTILSLQTQCFGQPKIIGHLKPHAFLPAPKVESTILRIKTHGKPLIDNYPLFDKIIKMAFSQKRKQICNSLKGVITGEICAKSGISPNQRPQELTLENWNKIIQNLNQ